MYHTGSSQTSDPGMCYPCIGKLILFSLCLGVVGFPQSSEWPGRKPSTSFWGAGAKPLKFTT